MMLIVFEVYVYFFIMPSCVRACSILNADL